MKTKPTLSFPLTIAPLLFGALTSFAQSLTVTNDLRLWLKADAGVTTNASGGVEQWNDQSTNANNAVQTVGGQAPRLVNGAVNNRPVLRFDGVDDFLDVADSDSLSSGGDMASFFVVKFDDFATYRAVWGKTAGPDGNLPAPTDIYALPDNGRLTVYRGDGTVVNISSTTTDQPLVANTYLAVGFDVAGPTLTHYLNNQLNGGGPTTTAAGDANTALKIGTRTDLVTKLKGDLAELLIYSRAISAIERSNVVNYLRTKYNLNVAPSVSLAATPPGPNVTVGDVITLNAAANDSDGTIARVEFLANGGSLGTVAVPPYSLRVIFDSPGTVQFTARATDNAGAFSNSAPVTFTATGGAPIELSVLSGLQLWLKADAGISTGPGGDILQWADQSGNGNNASPLSEGMAPVLTNGAVNGQPAVRFDGTDDFLEVADADSISITGDLTTFFVVRFTDFLVYRGIWGKTAVNIPAPTDIYAIQNDGRIAFYRGNGSMFANVNSAQTLPAGRFLLGSVEMVGTTVRHYYNGLLNGSGTITVPVADADGALRIGSRADGVTRMKGEMAEILIYNRALSATERHSVEVYLAGKYGLPAFISVTNNAPVVAITSPAGVVQAPGMFTVIADATDADGSIVSVQILANGLPLGTDTTAPYTADLKVPFGGVLTLSAIATDNLGAQNSSTPTRVCVQGPGGPSGLVCYWPFDGNANAVVGINGIMVSNPVPAMDRNGVAGGALSFNGAMQQRVEVPGGGGLNAAGHGTMAMLVKWTGTQDAGVVANSFGAVLGRQRNGIFSDNIIALNNASPDSAVVNWRQNSAGLVNISGNTVVMNDTWWHVAVTFTETNSELFVNGTSQGTGAGGVLHDDLATPLSIGAWIGDGASYATATIDEVAIWNRVLDIGEIQDLAAAFSTVLTLRIAPDCLTIERSGTNVVVRWRSNGILQGANEVAGSYADVIDPAGVPPGFVASPYTNSVLSSQTFYRLRSP